MTETILTRDEVVGLLAKKRGPKKVDEFLRETGLGLGMYATLSRVLKGTQPPTRRILGYLGLEPVTMYRKVRKS